MSGGIPSSSSVQVLDLGYGKWPYEKKWKNIHVLVRYQNKLKVKSKVPLLPESCINVWNFIIKFNATSKLGDYNCDYNIKGDNHVTILIMPTHSLWG